MKHYRYLTKIKNLIFFKNDLDLKTVRKIMQIYYNCLSPTESEKWQNSIDLILEHNTTQQTIVDSINQATVDNLVKELNELEKELEKDGN